MDVAILNNVQSVELDERVIISKMETTAKRQLLKKLRQFKIGYSYRKFCDNCK